MVYADYEYYVNSYGGSVIPAAAFSRLALRASAEIDHVTFGRIEQLGRVPDAVRNCTCELAERLQEQDTQSGAAAGAASENNDGYSITYRDDGGEEGRAHERYLLIRSYLATSGLMYRGIDIEE